MLSFAAAGFYGLAVLSCCGAAYVSRVGRQHTWHFNVWIAIAGLFIVLIVSRIFNLEEMVRADLRGWLRSEDMVDGRRTMQGVFIAGALVAFVATGFFAAYWVPRRIEGRRSIAVAIAGASGLIMIGIITMRTISLHAMDRLLYGPLKLNWIGDLGASGVIIAAAIYYVWLVRQPKRSKRR